jgi:hypothetical protein
MVRIRRNIASSLILVPAKKPDLRGLLPLELIYAAGIPACRQAALSV